MIDIILSANTKQDSNNILYLLELFKKELIIETYKIYIVVKQPSDLIFYMDSLSNFPGATFLINHHVEQSNSSSIYEKQVYHKSENSVFVDHYPETSSDFHEILDQVLNAGSQN